MAFAKADVAGTHGRRDDEVRPLELDAHGHVVEPRDLAPRQVLRVQLLRQRSSLADHLATAQSLVLVVQVNVAAVGVDGEDTLVQQ